MSFVSERIAGIVIADATVPGLPLIYVSPGFEMLTGYGSEEVLGRSCKLLQGPDTDPREIDILRQAIATGREAYATLLNYRKDGTAFWNEVALAAQRDADGQIIRYLGVQKDVSDRVRAHKRMHELAYSDGLTGLANRSALTEQLEAALADAQASGEEVALVFIDIDDFKKINDTRGHAAGDRLLQVTAARLSQLVAPTDTLARTGGDEFLLLMRRSAQVAEAAASLAARITHALNEPIALDEGTPVTVRASLGISTYPLDAKDPEDLLKHADTAMYTVKNAGKNGFRMYQPVSHKTGYYEDPSFDPVAAIPELERIIATADITPVFQPIVTLADRQVIGYEALARGPVDSELHRPDRLFAAAAAADRVEEVDWLCRVRAAQCALEAGLGRSATLFINCEPSTIDSECPEHLADIWARASADLQLMLEITERAVTDRPAELVRVVQEQRRRGRSIALDDLGADVRSLALLPFVEPDVIKLDLRLVQDRPTTEQAAFVSAVASESERTGAAIVAEGIETDDHLMAARALGATLGQGWLFGRPGPLPGRPATPWRGPVARLSDHHGRTPFEVIAPNVTVAEATKRLLLPMSHHLENRALRIGEGAVLLSAFQDAKHFTPATAARYTMLARGASLVGAFGIGLASAPIPGVRGAAIDLDDPLVGEWSVLVVAPHFAGALVAQDLGDGGPDRQRRFRFATTYRRELVIAAARTLLTRIAPVRQQDELLVST